MNRLTRKISQLPARLIMLISFASTSVINYLFGLAIGWLLLPGDYGLQAFVQTVLLIAGLILNSGFAWSITAEMVRADAARRAALVRGALVANLLLSLAFAAFLVLLFALGPLRTGLESWTVTLLVALTLPFLSMIAIANGAVRGAERFGDLALIRILEMGCRAAGGIVFVLAGFGVQGAVAGFLVGGIVAAVIGLWRVSRALQMSFWGAVARPSLSLAGNMFGALLGMALLLNLDVLALKLFSASAGRELTGHYQAAIMLANTPYYLATALLAVLFPQLARLKELRLTGPAVGEAVRLMVLALLPIEVVLILAPETILGMVFPPGYTAAAGALRILAVGNSAIILVATLSFAFQATGKARVPAVVLLSVTFCEAILLAMLVPTHADTGAATLFMSACLCSLVALGGLYLWALRPLPAARIIAWLGSYILCLGAALVVFLVVTGMTHSLFITLPLAAGSYLALALALGLIHIPEFVSQRGRWLRRAFIAGN